jgi:hypothetical protein
MHQEIQHSPHLLHNSRCLRMKLKSLRMQSFQVGMLVLVCQKRVYMNCCHRRSPTMHHRLAPLQEFTVVEMELGVQALSLTKTSKGYLLDIFSSSNCCATQASSYLRHSLRACSAGMRNVAVDSGRGTTRSYYKLFVSP